MNVSFMNSGEKHGNVSMLTCKAMHIQVDRVEVVWSGGMIRVGVVEVAVICKSKHTSKMM